MTSAMAMAAQTQASSSQPSLSKSRSVRSHLAGPSSLRPIVTSPPWARDEPPSPSDEYPPALSHTVHPKSSHSGTSTQDGSSQSNLPGTNLPYGQQEVPLWWMFTRRGREQGPPLPDPQTRHAWPVLTAKLEKAEKRPMRERAKSAWLASTQRTKSTAVEPMEGDPDPSEDEHRNRWGLHLPMPTPAPFTLAHNRTPGWDSPWTPRPMYPFGSIAGQLPGHDPLASKEEQADEDGGSKTKWYRRRKRIRAFILNNTYVPLLFRIVNITLTTAALAVATSIRRIEKKYGVNGAVGSSPTLVIIFAPLTLVHVMVAIYLEYFGRPLGLWRTSMKLIHTLSETFFICAWSAALSLCFDNFFTSVLECAPSSATSWYNEIPRIVPSDNPNLGRGEGQPGDNICDHQVALICLVSVGLIMYCSNLFISLFRIFEKVKYHTAKLPP